MEPAVDAVVYDGSSNGYVVLAVNVEGPRSPQADDRNFEAGPDSASPCRGGPVLDGRPAFVPTGMPLVGVGRPQDFRLGERSSGDLHPHRQALLCEPAGH